MTNVSYRPAWIDVDLDVVTTNASIMANAFAPAMLCVAVKANAYGHGAVQVAQAALVGGAHGLAVALVEEGIELRTAGIDAPILVLFEADSTAMDEMVRARLTPVLYTMEGLRAYSSAVARQGAHQQPVHLKIDTGMHRVGAAPAAFLELCKAASVDPHLFVEGVSTHFASADDPDNPFTQIQAQRFRKVLQAVFPQSPPPFAHCCNSAAALLYPELRMDMVRVGIALYGLTPSSRVKLLDGMRPVLSLRAQVGMVSDIDTGETVGYSQTYRVSRPGRIATIPIGYGDGIQRSWADRGEVLIGGKRRKIAGLVAMDQIGIDCGDDLSVRPGDEVVIIGHQGDEEITVEEVAGRLGTITYEVVTGMSARLPRRFIRKGSSVDVRQQQIDVGNGVFS